MAINRGSRNFVTRALTIPELLFALALAVILLGFIFPRNVCGPESALRARAGVVAKSIVHATNAYAADYGKMPMVSTPRNPNERFIVLGSPEVGATGTNAALFDVLRAIPRGSNSENALNQRQQKYLEEKKAIPSKTPRDGFTDGNEFPNEIQGQLLDPWGSQYCVIIETDGDGILDLHSVYSDLVYEVRLGCVAFSLDEDGTLGSRKAPGRLLPPKENSPCDIVTW